MGLITRGTGGGCSQSEDRVHRKGQAPGVYDLTPKHVDRILSKKTKVLEAFEREVERIRKEKPPSGTIFQNDEGVIVHISDAKGTRALWALVRVEAEFPEPPVWNLCADGHKGMMLFLDIDSIRMVKNLCHPERYPWVRGGELVLPSTYQVQITSYSDKGTSAHARLLHNSGCVATETPTDPGRG